MTDAAGGQTVSEQCDVIVVGAGAAGAAAALAAHAAGATVVVVDKGDESTVGGNTRVSGGGWFVHDDPARAATFLRALCGDYPVADEVVEVWARETAGNSRWLKELGADVGRSGDYHVEAEYAGVPGSECYLGMDTVGGRMGEGLLADVLAKALAARGLAPRLSTRVVALLTDGGAVTGVEVEGPSGTARLRARGGVVLATGGFSANPSMVRDYLRVPEYVRWGSPLSTGDGHALAQSVGADLWHMDNMMTIEGVRGAGDAGFFLMAAASHFVYVAKDGRRFVDECAANRHGHIDRNGTLELFPLRPFHMVFDERMRVAGPLSPPRGVLPVGWKMLVEGDAWSEDNSAEIESGLIARADSIEDLARAIGVDPETLGRTVAAYNAACATGRDDAFGRPAERLGPVAQPPFYALTVTPLLGWSNGGPRRDERARVLDTHGHVVRGLYAAGELSSTYSWAKDGGFHIADALAFGRVAGRDAAAQALRM
ncbi:FAD-dependent oxidoreductase [Rhodococcus sp. HNM0569]|uniref:FAD-dependent oxidoreductase n=1 Tax=Rhodococcus sp. HNM0569 TaxID=2716340 RepID=UPI00146B05D3|nr:FAD-dependent oxidoreductase [Rhodococcus sp. HNM0569]NLU84146.1 FAD-dependent oxidoreductase [Rhodococcus sp. HNM0569]